jgi:hypothetical protein
MNHVYAKWRHISQLQSFDIPPHAPKEVGVLNEFGKPQPNKLCSPIIFGTDLLASLNLSP